MLGFNPAAPGAEERGVARETLEIRAPMDPRRSAPAAGGIWLIAAVGGVFAAFGAFALLAGAPQLLARGHDAAGAIGAGVGLLFIAIGAGIVVLGRRGQRGLERRAALRAAHSGAPWMWRDDWRERRVDDTGSAGVVMAWAFAIFWNAVSAPVLWMLPRELARGNHAAWIALVFPLVGLGLGVWAVRETIRRRKFGRSALELKTLPGVIGGRFEAVIHTNLSEAPSLGFQVALACVNRITTGSGKNRSTREQTFWKEELTFPHGSLGLGVAGLSVPVGFTVPYECEPTSEENRDDRIVWRLTASAEVPGVDYTESFEVPLFETEASSPEVTGDEQAVTGAVLDWIHGAAPGPRGIACRPFGAAGVEFVFGAARNPGVATGISVFTLVWSGIVAFLFHRDALVMGAIFALFEALLVFATLGMWFGIATVRAEPGRLSVRRGLLGLGPMRVVTPDRLTAIRASIGMQSGARVWYRLDAELGDGKRLALGDGIPEKADARSIAQMLSRAVGLENSSSSQ